MIWVVFLLAACSKKSDALDYLRVNFEGLDGYGTLNYSFDYDKYYAKIFKFHQGQAMPQEVQEATDEIEKLKIQVKPKKDLANGDKVKLTVKTPKDAKFFKDSKQTIKVKDLGKAKKLTTKVAEQSIKLEFSGYDGHGYVRVKEGLPGKLSSIFLKFKNDGHLKNGKKTTLIVNDDFKNALLQQGYVVSKKFKPQFKVSGLNVIVNDPKKIKDYKSFLKEVDEYAKTTYEDLSHPDERNELSLVDYYYRELPKNDTDDYNTASSEQFDGKAGAVVGLYSVQRYVRDTAKEKSFVLIGFQNVTVDENNEVKKDQLNDFLQMFDPSDSKESIISRIKKAGFKQIKS